MGHYWSEMASSEEMDAHERNIKRFTDANALEYDSIEFSITGRVEGRVCRRCGAIVGIDGVPVHEKFHEGLSRVASDASWGGMNRPIGGR